MDPRYFSTLAFPFFFTQLFLENKLRLKRDKLDENMCEVLHFS